ncbi:MAG: DUF3772 domain-containing protein [Roseobacter sp.]
MMRITAVFLAFFLLVSAGPLVAQGDQAADQYYEDWENLAAVAETTLERDEAPNDRLEVLRDSLEEFRADFSAAREINAPRISTLRDQIAALGPAPENGIEPPELAARRAELEEQLNNLQAPVQVAQEAFLRANGLIGEIDGILRERQAQRLLVLGPSPLNPASWRQAAKDTTKVLRDIRKEFVFLSDPNQRYKAQQNAPAILLMTVVAMFLIVRGRTWAGRVLSYLRRLGGRGSGVWRFLVSLFRIFLPLAGLFLLTRALNMTGFFGPQVGEIVNAIPVFGAVLLGFRWLAERLFSRDEDEALIGLSKEGRKQARYYFLLISVFFVARALLEMTFSLENVGPATVAVYAFPIVVIIAFGLFCVGMLLRRSNAGDAGDGETAAAPTGMSRALWYAGTAAILVAIVAPVMAAVGYAEAGNAILYPTVLTLMICGFGLTLQRFAADVYGLVTGQGQEARDALIPVIFGILLAAVSLPFLALAWGARVDDLMELWSAFMLGFSVGETRISPADFITFGVIFGVGYAATRLLQNTLRTSVLPKTRLDIGGQNAFVSGLGYVGIFLAALLAITGAGIDLSSIALVAGALSVGIGFGLQTIVSNFVSGIILLVERPISEGDWIEVGGQMGYVRDISVRSTRIETFDRTDVIVPNADLVSGTVTNYTRGNTVGRLIVSVGVAYGTDTHKVSDILLQIAKDQPLVLAVPEPNVVFANFGADALEFEVRMFLRDVNWVLSVKSDVNHAIAARFAEEGIEIPFAQRDVWLRNPETLKADPA